MLKLIFNMMIFLKFTILSISLGSQSKIWGVLGDANCCLDAFVHMSWTLLKFSTKHVETRRESNFLIDPNNNRKEAKKCLHILNSCS